jgi:hypothetical protein
MSRQFSRFALSIAIAAALGSPSIAFAQDERDERPNPPRQERREPRHDHQRDLSDAVRRVERERGGQVLSAEPMEYEGRQVNRIKMVDDRGRVRVIMDDPHKPKSENKPKRDDRD